MSVSTAHKGKHCSILIGFSCVCILHHHENMVARKCGKHCLREMLAHICARWHAQRGLEEQKAGTNPVSLRHRVVYRHEHKLQTRSCLC